MGALKPKASALAGYVIGVYGSGGAPWHHLALAAAHGAEVRPVRAYDVAAGRLEGVDALIVPGGGATAMAGLLAPLGADGTAAIRAWVRRGGTYVASCAGSVLPLALAGAADAALPFARALRMLDVPLANPGDATLGGLSSPGVGRIRVRVDREHPYARGLPEQVELIHYNGPLFDLRAAPPGVRAFAWPTAPTDAFTAAEAFLPEGAESRTPTTIERCIAAGAATGIEAAFGDGRVVLFGSHPEFGLGPLLLGWGAGADLLVAALAHRPPRSERGREPGFGWSVSQEHAGRSAPELAAGAVDDLHRMSARFAALAQKPPDAWLDDTHAARFHGRDARSAWHDDTRAAAHVATAAALDLATLAPDATSVDTPWLDDAARADQDFGAMGLTQLVGRIDAMLSAAEGAAERPPRRPVHAYDLFDEHPYHLAVASYLSAAGLSAAALLVVATIAARRGVIGPHAAASLWAETAS
ncbi:MAG: hypothetical protein H0U69_05865 [Trueperaceae bacterium]|nr:hypothetical protein [Trueperaceae bacterium]